MKPKQAFILLSVVAALVAVIVVFEYVIKPGQAKKSGDAELLFPDLNLSSINGIEITSGDTLAPAVTLVRGGDSVWKVESKGGYPADAEAINGLLNSMKELKQGTLASESSASHERLGVDDKHGSRLKLKAGSSVAADLIVGNQGKSFGTYFARLAGKDQVYLILEDLKNLIDGSAGEWRDKKIFNEELGKVAEITLTVFPGSTAAPAPGGTAEGTAPLVRAPEVMVIRHDPTAHTWLLVRDGGTAETIEQSKGDGLARSLATLTAVQFADTATPAAAGLESPAKKAELKLEDGTVLTLLVGQEKDSKFSVKRADRDVIQTVYRYNIENIFKSEHDLMAPPDAPVDFDPGNFLPPPNLSGGTVDPMPDKGPPADTGMPDMFMPDEPAPEPVPEPTPPGDMEELATPPSLHSPPPGAPPPDRPDSTP